MKKIEKSPILQVRKILKISYIIRIQGCYYYYYFSYITVETDICSLGGEGLTNGIDYQAELKPRGGLKSLILAFLKRYGNKHSTITKTFQQESNILLIWRFLCIYESWNTDKSRYSLEVDWKILRELFTCRAWSWRRRVFQ